MEKNKEEKNDEKETASYRYGAHLAAGQLWTASRIADAH
jgi:hypothetical protein